MGAKKTKSKMAKSKSKSNLSGVAKSALGSVIGGGKSGGRRTSRRKSPEYWAKKVLVEKLKKKYFRIKYGGK